MNKNEQMREALQQVRREIECLKALQNGTVNHMIKIACGTIDRILQALAAEPAPMVRLTDEEVAIIANKLEQKGDTLRQFAHAIMDAMIAKNGGGK